MSSPEGVVASCNARSKEVPPATGLVVGIDTKTLDSPPVLNVVATSTQAETQTSSQPTAFYPGIVGREVFAAFRCETGFGDRSDGKWELISEAASENRQAIRRHEPAEGTQCPSTNG